MRKQNNVKKLQWGKAHKDWIIEQWSKSFGLTNRSSKSLGQIGVLTCSEELVKEQQPLHHTNHKAWRRLCYGEIEWERERESVCEGLLPIAKSRICTRGRANWIRPVIIAYCSIMRFHLECSLWVKDLYSCKMMTQSRLVDSTRGTLKAKRNSTSFNWGLGRHILQTSITLNWCGMNLIKNSKLNNPKVWLTSGNSCRKARQNYV